MLPLNDINEDSATTDAGNNPSLNVHQHALTTRDRLYSI